MQRNIHSVSYSYVNYLFIFLLVLSIYQSYSLYDSYSLQFMGSLCLELLEYAIILLLTGNLLNLLRVRNIYLIESTHNLKFGCVARAL